MSDILLVTGSRDGMGARARGHLRAAIARAKEVVVGDARGVDAVAREICEELGLRPHVFAADWTRLKKRAGPVRNGEMVQCVLDTVRVRRRRPGHPDFNALCVAFPAPDSTGTWDCIRQAVDARIPVLVRSAW